MKHFSSHANLSCAHRGISGTDVELVLLNGTRQRSFQDVEVCLTDRALAKSGLPEHLRGLTVIVTPNGTIRTAMFRYKIKKRPGLLSRAQMKDDRAEAEMRIELKRFIGGAA